MTVAIASTNLLLTLREQGLTSRFQAIIDLTSGTTHGYEALIRGPKGTDFQNPERLYAQAEAQACIGELDLLCVENHLKRFGHIGLRSRLFINLVPSSLLRRQINAQTLLELCNSFRIKPQQLVLEITENHPAEDYEALNTIAGELREAGFDIAIDDLGSGYSGLRQWSEILPEYVKIDRHFVQGVEQDAHKRQFVHSIVEIARTLGSKVIAEGIETQAQLDSLRELGVTFGQGFLICRPETVPPRISSKRFAARETLSQRVGTSQAVSAILKRTPMCAPGTLAGDIVQRFLDDAALRTMVVVDGTRPKGILTRQHVMAVYASRYGESLYYKRPIETIMQNEFLQVKSTTPLHSLSTRLTDHYEDFPEQDLVIVDNNDNYQGTTSFVDLLKAITQLQVNSAKYANPLTQLPGSVPVNQFIDELLIGSEPFFVAYCDLDNFKPFNDVYGYALGDDVIRTLARILQLSADDTDMIGHVGGDDFIVVMRGSEAASKMEKAIQRLEREVPRFYSLEDREAGCISAKDRRGNQVTYPLLTVSIGLLQVEPFEHGSHKEIATRASEVKAHAKRMAGNSLFIDRRRGFDGGQAFKPN